MFRIPGQHRLVMALALTIMGTCACPTSLSAQAAALVKITETTELDAVGNGTVKALVTTPPVVYTKLKVKSPNVATLLRQFGVGRGWAVLENVNANFNDVQSCIEIGYTVRGFARGEQGNRWSLAIAKDSDLQLLDIHDRTAIYQGSINSDGVIVNIVERVLAPLGSKNLKNNSRGSMLTYEFEPKKVEGDKTDATFQIESKDSLMGCLAKCYSNENFGALWTAKGRFDNTGTTTLSDYKIRFRIAGFSDWSTWRHTAKVYAGQAVVDPFFPVFDIEKLSLLTGTRAANLEYEYQYRRPDGQMVTETDTKKVQLLGYNETIFTSLAPGEIMSQADQFEYFPFVLSSFTAPNDPVVQQLAGRVSALVPKGINDASLSNKSAIAFAKALYEWMVDNKISYQTPPVYLNGSAAGQHLKYARDVLRNHAGTCVDLAIFWASACESVNLQTGLFLVPGHCFPVIKLPEGGVLAVEATDIVAKSFDDAVKDGMKEVEIFKDRNDIAILVDVRAHRQAGIQPIDLPRVADTFLTDLGYEFKPRKDEAAKPAAQKPADNNVRPATDTKRQTSADNDQKPNGSIPASMVGNWSGTVRLQQGGAIQGSLILQADGQMSFSLNADYASGESRQLKGAGQWKVSGDSIVLIQAFRTDYYPFQVKDGRLAVFVPSFAVEMMFNRVQG